MEVWHVVVMMDMEINQKGHREKLSHFPDFVNHTVHRQQLALKTILLNPWASLIQTSQE